MTRLWVMLMCMATGIAGHAEKVGLVLSGGGAKGIAHIGVIKALEDNGIPIDYVTGTSMGAVVGSLYSCGWSPDEILALVKSRDFYSWSTGQIDESLTYYLERQEPTPRMLQLQFDFKDTTKVSTNILSGPLINPIPMNFEFMRLFSPYTAQCGGNFDRLFVPFRCVASDVYHKHKIVCASGSLGDAVRASMSFPMVFKPIEMNGVLVYDGGIYDNFPVDVMHEDFNPDVIIGVSVSGPDTKPIAGDLFQQLEDMIIQNNDYSVPENLGVKIQVPVLQFGVLDFGKADEIYAIGYRTGLAMLDKVKARVQTRVPAGDVASRRMRWRRGTPELSFDSVGVSGIEGTAARYVKFCFEGLPKRDTISVGQARNAYYRLVSSGKIEDIRPTATYNAASGRFNMMVDVDLKKKWSAGFGGWLTSSSNSMLYLTAGYHTLSYNALDADIAGWLGQNYYSGFGQARFTLKSAVPSYMQIQLCGSRRKYYESDVLFSLSDNPVFITTDETYARAEYAMAMTRRYRWSAGVGAAYQRDYFFPGNAPDFDKEQRDRCDYRTVAIQLELASNSLNNNMYPSTGQQLEVCLQGLHERSHYRSGITSGLAGGAKKLSRNNLMASVHWTRYYPLSKSVSIGASADVRAMAGKLGENYYAALVHAPAFGPTPSTRYAFNEAFRAYNYVAIGASPVWQLMTNLQLRGDFYLFCPIRQMEADNAGAARYGAWFRTPQFMGEAAAVYNFSFASLSVYGNYLSRVAGNWNFGIAFGLMFEAPRFRK